MLADCAEAEVRTYTPEAERPQGRMWADKLAHWEEA